MTAIKKTLIRVEQRHIYNGIKGNCSECPIALAIAETFNVDKGRVSATGTLTIDKRHSSDYLIIANTPDIAKDFMNDFDSGLQVKPFEFEMEYNELH